MNRPHRIRIAFFAAIISLVAFSAFGKTHVVKYSAYTYSPDSLSVFIGDTIQFSGSFHDFPLQISGAAIAGPIDSGNIYLFVVRSLGTYLFQTPIYSKIGMEGIFRAFNQNME